MAYKIVHSVSSRYVGASNFQENFGYSIFSFPGCLCRDPGKFCMLENVHGTYVRNNEANMIHRRKRK